MQQWYSTESGLTTYNRGSKYQLLSVPPFSGHLVPDLPTVLGHCILNLEIGGQEEDGTQKVLLRAVHHCLFLPSQLGSLLIIDV